MAVAACHETGTTPRDGNKPRPQSVAHRCQALRTDTVRNGSPTREVVSMYSKTSNIARSDMTMMMYIVITTVVPISTRSLSSQCRSMR